MRYCLLVYLFLSSFLHSRGQEYSYTQYNVKDGLAGSVVYCAAEDKDGFLWFGTESGLSRFDGTHFRNFTTSDGLPDNEIIKLYLDKHNNVWFISLMGIPSVFYHNSIIRLDSCTGVRTVCEDGLTDAIVMVKVNFGEGVYGYYQSVNKSGKWNFVFLNPDPQTMFTTMENFVQLKTCFVVLGQCLLCVLVKTLDSSYARVSEKIVLISFKKILVDLCLL